MRPYAHQSAGVIMIAMALTGGCTHTTGGRLKGFQVSQHWAEQTKEFTYDPGVRVHINAPSEADFDRHKPTHLVFYALPNGNSIEWTIGRSRAEGLDWHYYIQHIGAQTRRLREVIRDHNIIVAYLEAEQKSWPAWRRKHKNNSELIAGLITTVRQQIDAPNVTVVLSSHSGGGSLIFGYLNGVEQIPADITRIVFLDSNYGFSADEGHGTKLLDWLNHDPHRCLVVLAYDDREITFKGKKVVGPTGGTYRATQRMLGQFEKEVELTRTMSGDCVRHRGLDGRMDIIVHQNPENRILHTVLVGDMNGFIHAITSGTGYEDKVGVFGAPVAYEKWIQSD